MNFGGVPAGLLLLFGADTITTDYILGKRLQAAGRPVQVAISLPPSPTCDRVGGACLRFTPAKLSNANDGEQMFCASKHKLAAATTGKKKRNQTLDLIKQIKG